MEEKTEQLSETREELEKVQTVSSRYSPPLSSWYSPSSTIILKVQTSILPSSFPLPRLKTENLELCQDARAAKTYRDELDVLRERAEKVDKLESELLR